MLVLKNTGVSSGHVNHRRFVEEVVQQRSVAAEVRLEQKAIDLAGSRRFRRFFLGNVSLRVLLTRGKKKAVRGLLALHFIVVKCLEAPLS